MIGDAEIKNKQNGGKTSSESPVREGAVLFSPAQDMARTNPGSSLLWKGPSMHQQIVCSDSGSFPGLNLLVAPESESAPAWNHQLRKIRRGDTA